MGKEFMLSAATPDHEALESLLARAREDGGNPALLPGLFRWLAVASRDKHLGDRYAPGIIAAISGICRNCSGEAGNASAALRHLECVFRKGDADTRAYAADAACLLGTPQALRFVLMAAGDPDVLRMCGDLEEHVDRMVGMIYAAEPLSGLHELGRMLSHTAYEIRHYAANRLLLFGEPGQPEVLAQEAHRLLAKGAREGCFEARLLLRRGHELSESPAKWPASPRGQRVARAACAFCERVKSGGAWSVPEELWKGPGLSLARSGELQCPPRRLAAGRKRPELRIVGAENPAGRRGSI